MSSQNLHSSLLRTPVLHILRAAGFHSTRPSVLDTLVNITERYLLLLATTTAAHANANHNTPVPTITDVRMALTDCGVLTPTQGGAEEEWKERIRIPLSEYDNMPSGLERKQKEMKRRQEEDTQDVREFISWIVGDKNKEIRRVAGMLSEGAMDTQAEDYLTMLKKKHSKTGEEARYQGTVLGIRADDKPMRIEGGPVESLHEWNSRLLDEATRVVAVKPVVTNEDDAIADEAMEDAPS